MRRNLIFRHFFNILKIPLLLMILLITLVVSQKVQKIRSKAYTADGSEKYFRFTMRDNPNEYFFVKITDTITINKALNDLYGSRELIVGGTVRETSGGFNIKDLRDGSYWSWHLDPVSIVLERSFIELCDGRPSYVEERLIQWIGRTFCPWQARVDSVYDYPPLPPSPTPVIIPSSTPTPTPSDTIAPLIEILNPKDGSIVRRGSDVIISTLASDNIGVRRVEFTINGLSTCVDFDSPYTCNWRVPAAKRVNYRIVAKAFDRAGNYASDEISVSSN
ncbi:Ig-like domain-containing protein [Candidatus Woesebacteria bacterium]|nr:Ig-like domain-containing protein [Candidatus Woesebacteria bacterium]